ncbi:MAG: hypothetical protein JW891_02935 [Candidatus Lokiarchaeota archaeon]|nr:hypothetical protein [Candidatus Lokiarchaeota archaeon]
MLVLSYFDTRLGPRVFLTIPLDLISRSGSASENIDNIKNLLDRDDEGFFIHNFSPELKTANLVFNIFSKWARGRQETIMISAICSEEEPDYFVYESVLTAFKEKISAITDIYKAFYRGSISREDEADDIKTYYRFLKNELKNVDKSLSIKPIETHGQLVNSFNISKNHQIDLPTGLIQQIGDVSKKNYFLVYRTRGNVVKIDMIPINADEVFSLRVIFGEKMTLPIIQQISEILSKHESKNLTLIFTTGICQEGSKCIYEAYINTSKKVLEHVMNSIANISGIFEIVLELITIQKN